MIATQYIKLNMVPSGYPPVLYMSQYDAGRPVGFVVSASGSTPDLDGYTVTLEGTRSDGTPVTAPVTTDGNICALKTTATMTNKVDRYPAQIVVTDGNGNRIASIPVTMMVVKAAMNENAEGVEEDRSLYQQYTGTVQSLIADIRTQLGAEASARQAADNQLQSNINAEASTRATQDASLQSQINQLIAPSGEAPSAAEVENARVGADGTVYPTLGDAIRTQDTQLKSALDAEIILNSAEVNPFTASNWRVGGISPTSGVNSSISTSISTNTTVYINPGDGITYLKAESGYSFYVFAYSPDGTYVGAWNGSAFVKAWTYKDVTEFYVLWYPDYKFRVELKRSDSANMTTDQFVNLKVFENGSPEIHDLRVAADDVTYQTAGEAVRKQFVYLNNNLNGNIRDTSVAFNPYTKNNWRVGYISPTTGENASVASRISTNTNVFFNPLDGVTYLTAESGYKFYVYAYAQDGNYVGAWNGTTFAASWSYVAVTEFNILAYPAYKFRVSLLRTDDADMTTAEFDKLNVFYTVTDAQGYRGTLHQNNLAENTTMVKGFPGTSGAITPSSEISNRETTTDFIPVEVGKTYVFTMFVDSTVEFFARICFYDALKSYTSRADFIDATGAWRNFNCVTYRHTMPAGTAYVRVSTRHGFSLVTKGVTEWDYSVSPIDIRRHWNYRPKQDYFVRTVNHRGYSRIAPENTAPAFELSADLGFWGVENDIRFTSDGVPVLLHDPTINRTARNADGTEISGDVYISQITYEQALTYDFGIWMGEKYKGTKIMTFEQFVSLCRKKSLHMYNEIKAGTEAQVASLVQIVKRYGMQKHCSWISFSTTYLEQVCTYDDDARIGLIISTFEQSSISTLTGLQTGTNTVFTSIHGDNNSNLTNELIDALIAADIELEMYTINFTTVMEALNPYVTGVTSDWLIGGDALYTGRNDIIVFDN